MGDPTENLRAEFVEAFIERFDAIRDRVDRALGDLDVFALARDAEQPRTPEEIADDSPRILSFKSRRENVAAFVAWLESVVEEELLRPVENQRDVANGDHWSAQFVRMAYSQGWFQARNRLRVEGVNVGPDLETEAVFDLPVATETLSRYYQRTYEDLLDLSDDVTAEATTVLTNAFAEGVGPREAARRVDDAVAEIDETRGRVIARTRTIDTYTDATIDRYRDAGVAAVEHGEFSDSDDARVCPICEELDGREIPLVSIEEETFEFDPPEGVPDSLAGTFGVKPPIHPNGRCVLLPVID